MIVLGQCVWSVETGIIQNESNLDTLYACNVGTLLLSGKLNVKRSVLHPFTTKVHINMLVALRQQSGLENESR